MHFRAWRRRLALLGLSCVVLACSEPEQPATAVLVWVEADSEVAGALTEVRALLYGLDATEGSAPYAELNFPLKSEMGRGGKFTMPLSFGISKGKSDRFRLVVLGFGSESSASPRIERKTILTFQARQTIEVVLRLPSACLDRADECSGLTTTCEETSDESSCVPVSESDTQTVRPVDNQVPEDAGATGRVRGMDRDSGEEGGIKPLSQTDASVSRPPMSVTPERPSRPDAGMSADSGGAPDSSSGDESTCCPDGVDCICRGDEPSEATLAKDGPYKVAEYNAGFADKPGFLGASIFYPEDAPAPLSAIVMCPGFTGAIADLAQWGPFMASHGIVVMIIDTNNPLIAIPERVVALEDALESLKQENRRPDSPLKGRLSEERFAIGGTSMGGGAAWVLSGVDSALKASIVLAGHHTTAGGASIASAVQVPTLMLATADDPEMLGGGKQSQEAYRAIPEETPKIMYEMPSGGNFAFNSPDMNPAAGHYVLAFLKTYLDGDVRYRKFLLVPGANDSEWLSNIE
jgi:hypothetical protein